MSNPRPVSLTSEGRGHAIVIGGSMAGLLAARVLSDHFDHVTILERDPVQDAPEARKGQPQARHLHGLLAKGFGLMQSYFPGLANDLVAGGATLGDMGAMMRWYHFGGYKRQFQSGLIGVLMSRPFLEWQIRRRVLALPNVALRSAVAVTEMAATADRSRVTGVKATARTSQQVEMLDADLVVDASGRGSAAPKWLEALGYGRPAETEVKVDIAYATRVYRRRRGDMVGAELLMIVEEPPAGTRMGLVFPIEGDRWICSLGGQCGDHPPTDEVGFMEFARSLPTPEVYHLISRAEPLSAIMPHKFPASLRHHYEKLARFPAGFLVMGDAIASFNPIYGQGMTSAVMQAEALDQALAAAESSPLFARFFGAAAKVVDLPWQLAVGEDFRFPQTEGKKAPGTDLINAYVTHVHRATHQDTVVYAEFLKVMNLMQPPASLLKPAIAWRVWRASRHARTRRPVPVATPALGA
jgi:2-polyprenyl-6-methoxyphenol hydroxylase-like FAD-dependent oxidoreductase